MPIDNGHPRRTPVRIKMSISELGFISFNHKFGYRSCTCTKIWISFMGLYVHAQKVLLDYVSKNLFYTEDVK